jgi:predicted RNA binding protein YcfA (HicA-like mRNA interferase family)
VKKHKAYRTLKDLGFELVRQEGSHEVWKRGTEEYILPTHKGKELKKYLIRKLEKLKGGQ